MQKITHQQLLDWLKKEVKLSLGCTEPIAIAYAAAVAAKEGANKSPNAKKRLCK